MTTTIKSNQTSRVLSAVQRGAQRALKRAMEEGRTHAVKAISAELGVKQALVKKKLIVEVPSSDVPSIALRFTGKRFRLIDVAPGKRERVPSMFQATVGTGRHRGWFVRKDPSRSRKGKPRSSPQLPIRELFSLSAPFVAIKNHILESTRDAAVAALDKNLTHEVGRAVSGAA